eukprot:Filipodium_phascolosomae@DN6966_c0_g1_i1.p1
MYSALIPLLVGSAVTSIASSVVGTQHQSTIMTDAVNRIKNILHSELSFILDEALDVQIKLQHAADEEVKELQSVKILCARLKLMEERIAELTHDPREEGESTGATTTTTTTTGRNLAAVLEVAAPAALETGAAAAGIGGVTIRSGILSGNARANAISGAVSGFNAA